MSSFLYSKKTDLMIQTKEQSFVYGSTTMRPFESNLRVALLLGLCIAACVVWSLPSFRFIGYILTISLIGAIAICPQKMIPYVIILLLVGPDISQVATQASTQGVIQVGSPWQMRLGPISPSAIQMFTYIIAVFRIKPISKPFFLMRFVTYAFIIGIIGFVFSKIVITEFTVPLHQVRSDIRMVLYLIMAGTLFNTFLKRFPEEIQTILQFIVIIFISQMLVALFLWFTGVGSAKCGVSSGSADSTKWVTIVIINWAILNIINSKKIVISSFIMLLGLLLVYVSMSRQNYVTAIAGISIVFIIARKTRVLFLGIPLVLFGVIVGGIMLQNLAPADALRIYSIRFTRLQSLITLDFEHADPYRFKEFINCFLSMAHDGSILIGRGFGGYYTDSILPMGVDMISAFPPWVEAVGHFPRIHNMAGNLILKFGIVGFVLWISVWWKSMKHLLHHPFARDISPTLQSARIVMIASFPAVLLAGYWSAKGIILTALFLVLSNHISSITPSIKLTRNNKVN